MIRPLRRAHRRIVLILSLVLPLVVALALLLRPEQPVQREWPFDSAHGVPAELR